jgi:hypothetical protein
LNWAAATAATVATTLENEFLELAKRMNDRLTYFLEAKVEVAKQGNVFEVLSQTPAGRNTIHAMWSYTPWAWGPNGTLAPTHIGATINLDKPIWNTRVADKSIWSLG